MTTAPRAFGAALLLACCAAPHAPGGALEAGTRALSEGRLDEAVSSLDEAVREQPQDLDAARLRVEAYLRAGRLPELARALERAAAERPGDPVARYALGLCLLVGQAPGRPAAVAHLRAATQGLPRNPEPWLRLGAALLELDDAAGARPVLERAVALAPEEARGHLLLALALARLELERDAMASLRRAIEAGPLPADVERARPVARVLLDPLRGLPPPLLPRVKAAMRKVESGDTLGAEAVLEPLARENPDVPAVLELLAACHEHLGETVAAVAELGRAAALDPSRPHARRHLADLHQRQGRHELAAPLYEQVVELDPFDEGARSRVASYALARGDAPGAVRQLRTLLVLTGGDPDVRLRLARARLRAGDRPGALADLEALADAPDANPEALLELGELHLSLAREGAPGSRDRAREIFDRALAARPGDPAALRGLSEANGR